MAGVLLDTPPSDTRIMQAAEAALSSWRGLITETCTRAGIPHARASFVASVAISALEGALIQARAAANIAPLTAVGEALSMIIAAELQKISADTAS